MPGNGLTDQQIAFLDKYVGIPKFFGKKKSKKKRAEYVIEFERFNIQNDWVKGKIDKMADGEAGQRLLKKLNEAEGLIEAGGKKPDFESGHQRLVEINQEIEKHKLADRVSNALKTVTPLAEAALAAKTGSHDEIQMLWLYVSEYAEYGMRTLDADKLNSAMSAIGKLTTVIAAAEPAKPMGDLGGAKGAAVDMLATQATFTSAKAQLLAAQMRLTSTEETLDVTFDTSIPQALKDQITAIKVLLNVSVETASGSAVTDIATEAAALLAQSDKIKKAAQDAVTALDTLDRDAKQLTAEYDAWKKILAEFTPRLETLQRHDRRDYRSVKILREALEADLISATDKAALSDFTGATNVLGIAKPKVEAAITLADDWAEIKAISRDRWARIGTLADPASLSHNQAKTAIAEAKKFHSDAVIAHNGGDIAECAKLLGKIPSAVENAIWLTKLSKEYSNSYAYYGNKLTHFNGLSAEIKAALDPDLTVATKTWTDAACATDGDIQASMQKLTGLHGAINSLKARANNAEAYFVELIAFKARLKLIKERENENGRIAIEAFYLQLQADEAFAATKAASKEFAFAVKTLESGKGAQVAMLALADIAKDHLTRKKALEDKVTELKAKTGAAANADAIAAVASLITVAWTTGLAGNWAGSIDTLKQAEKQATLIETLIADAAELDAAKDETVLDGVGDSSSFDAAFAIFQTIHGMVRTKDDGTFAKRLENASKTAIAAQALATGAPAKFAEAGTGVKAAITECEAILTAIGVQKGYKIRLTVVKTAHDTTLPALNADDCIKPDIDAIKTVLTEVETLVAPAKLDFAAADAKLKAVFEIIRKAEVNAAAYAGLKPDIVKIDACLTYLKDATRKDGMDVEIVRLTALQQEIKDLIAARDLGAAKVKAAEGAALDAGYRSVAAEYAAAKAKRKSSIEDQLHFIQAKPACAIELAKVTELNTRVGDLFDARAYKLSLAIISQAANVIFKGYYLVIDFTAWELSKTAGETALANVMRRQNNKVAAVASKEEALEKLRDLALKAADERNYKTAKKRMDELVVKCTDLEPLLLAYESCDKIRKEAGDLLGQVGKLTNKDVIEPLMKRLRGKHQNTIKTFDTGDFAAAQVMFAQIKIECQEAIDAATKSAEYSDLVKDINELADADSLGLQLAIDNATQHVAEMRGMPDSLYIHPDILAAEAALKAAQDKFKIDADEAGAKVKLEETMKHCATGRINLGHYGQLVKSAKFTQDQIGDLLTTKVDGLIGKHPAADAIQSELKALRTLVDKSILDLRGDPLKRSATSDKIEEIMVDYHRLRLVADGFIAFFPKRDEVENDILTMEAQPSRYAIKPQMDSVRTLLAQAIDASAKHDHKNAMKHIAKARDIQVDALLLAKMESGGVPSADEIKKILQSEGGSKRFDKIVESLDPKAKREILVAAFEARNGCKLNIFTDKSHEDTLKTWHKNNPNATGAQYTAERDRLRATNISQDLGKKGPNISRLYKVMDSLPDSDTLDNDSMLILTNIEGAASGSDYSGHFKEVTMREGASDQSGYYGVALPHELDSIDEDSKPVEGEKMTFFSWNTLHEVGHAVDDRANFMDRRGEALGGWKVYGVDVVPIAKLIAAQTQFDDVGYIAAYMSGTADPPIPEPKGCDAEEWERRRAGVKICVDRAREGKNPWGSSNSAKACSHDGIAYQESYANNWSTYPIAQRSKGVSGYQFRAPGEWFSELYAAYHSGKMNPSHPARAWIEDL